MPEKHVNVDEKPLIQVSKGKRRAYFLILYGLFVADFIARVGINSIMPLIQSDLKLTDGQIGSLVSCVAMGMAIFVLPISFLGEKYSTKKAITLSSVIWGVGSLISGATHSFYTLLVARFMVGTGNSAYAALSNSLITGMYPKSRWGKQIGLYNTAMTLGMAAGALFFANLATQFHWRTAFYAIGGITLVLTLLSLTLPDNRKETAKATSVKTTNEVNLRKVFNLIVKNKTLIGVYLGAGFSVFAVQSILTYASIFCVREMDMTVSAAANIVSFMALLALLGYPVGGAVLDKWYSVDKRARIWMPAVCFALCAVMFFLGFSLKNVILIAVGYFFFSCANTCFHAASQELVPVWFKSVSYGGYVMFCQLFGAIGPFVTGLVSDAFGISMALCALQAVFVLATIVCVIVGFGYNKCYEKARNEEISAGMNS